MAKPVAGPRRLNAEQQRLVEDHRGLAYHHANRLRHRGKWVGLDHDDLVQIGMLALVESAGRYDPSRGLPFASYAGFRAWGAIVTAINERRGQVTHSGHDPESLYQPIRDEPDPFDDFVAADCQLDARTLVDRLSGRRRDLIALHCGLDGPPLSQAEIAQKLGMAQSRVSQILRQAMSWLRAGAT